MLFSLAVLFLVPLALARSTIKPDSHVASHSDRSSPLVNLFSGLDAPVFNGAVLQGSGYNLRSIGSDGCDCRCIDDDCEGYTGCLCVCQNQEVPTTQPNCLRACEPLENANFCLRVCPSEEETNIHTSRDVPIFELTKAVHQGSEHKKRSIDETVCVLGYEVDDQTTGNTGYIFECEGRELPSKAPKCLRACEFSEIDGVNSCVAVCSSQQTFDDPEAFHPSIHKRA